MRSDQSYFYFLLTEETVHTSFFRLEVLAVISLDIFSQCKASEVPKSTRLNSLVMICLMSVMEKLMKCDTQVQTVTLLMDVKFK